MSFTCLPNCCGIHPTALRGGCIGPYRFLRLAALVCYVLRGWMVSRTGVRGLLDLLLAPWYMAWKVSLGRRANVRSDAEWIRTTREGSGPG